MASTFSQSQLFEHLKVVKIIQKIATVLGLSVPNLYNYRGLSGYFLIYAILLCIILICTTALSLYGRFVKTYINDVLSTVILTDVFFYLAPITTYTVSIIWTILFRRRDLLRFVRALRDLEKSLNTKFYFEYKYNENKLFSYFILFEIFICSYIFYAILHISIIDFQIKVLLFNLNFFLSIFSMSIICMQISQHMINLRYMFKFLNRKLYKTINYYSNDKPLNIIGDEFLKSGSPKPNYVEMNFFLKKYDILCDLVDLFAKVYGLQMLFITLTITVMIIRNLNMTLKVALGVAKNIPQHGINFMMGDAVFSSIICVVFGLLLAICGDLSITESKKTSNICYKLLLNFLNTPTSLREKTTKEELYLLADLMSKRDVHFSAAGFFNIDYSMLFMIFGAIAAYLVIILQFK